MDGWMDGWADGEMKDGKRRGTEQRKQRTVKARLSNCIVASVCRSCGYMLLSLLSFHDRGAPGLFTFCTNCVPKPAFKATSFAPCTVDFFLD